MNTFEMVVIVVFLALLAGVLNNYIKGKNSKPDIDPQLHARLKRLDALEERVRVLEKIVTDRDYELRKEFRNL